MNMSPDISMCANEECPLKEKCYRYTAKPEMMQSYGDFKPDENGECEYFWDNKKQLVNIRA
jgi:hypothetical protein